MTYKQIQSCTDATKLKAEYDRYIVICRLGWSSAKKTEAQNKSAAIHGRLIALGVKS
jgi:hypothetical protein